MQLIDYYEPGFHSLDSLRSDTVLKDLVHQCIDVQRRAVRPEDRMLKHDIDVARENVSDAALARILEAGRDVSGLGTTRDLSNCIVFLAKSVSPNHVFDSEVLELRTRIDDYVHRLIPEIFRNPPPLSISSSGHFWYPPGGFMGWHTNNDAPGWRFYISFADEPGKSYFRYRDPVTGTAHTLLDEQWDFRLFSIAPQRDFWHAIYSDSNRFSIGFRIRNRPNLVRRVASKGIALLRNAGPKKSRR